MRDTLLRTRNSRPQHRTHGTGQVCPTGVRPSHTGTIRAHVNAHIYGIRMTKAERRAHAPLRVFIGSSSEGKTIAEYLQLALDDFCDAVVWDQGVFGVSASFLSSLITATREYEFAVLVVTPDDLVQKRGNVGTVPRDNVIFELGLFMGAIGPERTFIVHSQDDGLDLPSDLAGITRETYRPRADGNLRSSLRPLALRLREAMNDANPAVTRRPSHIRAEPMGSAEKYLRDLLEAFPTGRMGVKTELVDEGSFYEWTGNLLGMLVDLFARRQSDAYAAWLRPLEGAPSRLAVFQERNMPAEYIPYEFHHGEGLAGKVWASGEAAATSEIRQHPWWVFREGCLTEAYVCVPVGAASGPGGILAVGSFAGFDATIKDMTVLGTFGALLALVPSGIPRARLIRTSTPRSSE